MDREKLIKAIAKQWKCMPMKLADDQRLHYFLLGFPVEGHYDQRQAVVYMMDGGNDIEPDNVPVPFEPFAQGAGMAKHMKCMFIIVLITNAGAYYCSIRGDEESLTGDFGLYEHLYWKVSSNQFKKLEVND